MSRKYAPREPWTGPEGPDLPRELRPRKHPSDNRAAPPPEMRIEALRRALKRALVALSLFPKHAELCKDIRVVLGEEISSDFLMSPFKRDDGPVY